MVNFPRGADRAAQLLPTALPGHERSLLTSLAAFTVVICLGIAALFMVTVMHARTVAVNVATRAAENLAASFAQQTSDTCEAVDGALLSLAQRVEADGTGPRSREALRETMAALVTTMPRLHGLLIVDAAGRMVVSNGSSALRPDLSFRDRPYFRYHREHAVASAYISGPARSETEAVSLIYVTRRIERDDGRFDGIAIAQIEVDYFQQRYRSVDLGPGGTLKLVADDGMMLIRQPPAPLRSLLPEPLFAEPYKYESAGSYVASSYIDGVRRLNAFRRVDRYPLIVVIGLAERDYLADWQYDAWVNGCVRAFVIVMTICFAAGLRTQIKRRKRAEDSLAALALLDGLTGIANRRQFDLIFDHEWRRAERDQTPLALLIIDVDNFKAYNDIYGHVSGDDALIILARAISAGAVRPGDLAARYGGEEFVVILSATDTPSAVCVAERIRFAILELGIPHSGVSGALATVSIGVASMIPDGRVSSSTLVSAADAALYDAKGRGRNRTSATFAAPESSPAAPVVGSA